MARTARPDALGRLAAKDPEGRFDRVYSGTEGDDVITLGFGNDRAYGHGGNDTFHDAYFGDDVMEGGAGHDVFNGGTGSDTLDGGSGVDTVDYSQAPALAAVDLEAGFALAQGIDTLISIENVMSGDGNDSLLGSGVGNILFSNGGNDRLDGRGGNDELAGGLGNDTLAGGSGFDRLGGGHGDDSLDGGIGDDVLNGDDGNDLLTGGLGADRFEYGFNFRRPSQSEGFDTITDFRKGSDKIDVRMFDARSDIAGDQAFTFDATPDSAAEDAIDGLSDDPGSPGGNPGPTINAERGEIEFKHQGGFTYVYLGFADRDTAPMLRLEGTITLAASDFIL